MILVLAGINVDRMTGEEKDEVLEQLRERLEVLNDAVAAVDWSVQGYGPVVELPELEEWHEPGWDILPRTGRWAEGEGDRTPIPIHHANEPEPESSSHPVDHDADEPNREPEPERDHEPVAPSDYWERPLDIGPEPRARSASKTRASRSSRLWLKSRGMRSGMTKRRSSVQLPLRPLRGERVGVRGATLATMGMSVRTQ